jgi:hypothetical protein
VFQSCIFSPVNDVVVQILSGFDVYEGHKTLSMDSFNNQNLQLMMGCKLRDEDDGQLTSLLDMDCFLPGVSFQPTLSLDSKDCYLQ